MQYIKPLTLSIISSLLIACGGDSNKPAEGGDGPKIPPPTNSNQEFLLFTDRPTSGSSLKNLYQLNPVAASPAPKKLNSSPVTNYVSHPALPLGNNEWIHSIVWVEGEKIWGTDSATENKYALASSPIVTDLCELQHKTPSQDGTKNLLLIRDNGADSTCSSDDQYYTLNYNNASPQALTPISGEIIKGFDGGIIVNDIADNTYSYFTDTDGKTAIFDQSIMQVTARYDISNNILWGPTLNESIFIVVNDELFLAPFSSLVDGSFTFTGGVDLEQSNIDMKTANGMLYISSHEKLLQYDPTTGSLSTVATLGLNSTAVIVIDESHAYLVDRSATGAIVYEISLATGTITPLIESSDQTFSVFHMQDKLWTSDQAEAKIYDTTTGNTTTIDDATFNIIGWSDSVEIVLTKDRTFDGVATTNGYIAKYEPESGSEVLNYGEYEVPYVYLGWHGSRYRLGVDHDYYKLFLIDFESSNSLKEVWESTGVISLPF
ncbi:SMP-30/gluconolactonase/LRE family protein [Alkalimarinus alittae]|uniref:Uncharacterized protein n=1 Tax=Alkalimarinus alittae TaxID=2961619 RepID=A0ABY6N4N9_9ALTE|nr:hypothetical protein [Alkalimarinus alittae]UZE96934.1 hypothetical protein NKI27_04060 [Alkalimarinus alittae]